MPSILIYSQIDLVFRNRSTFSFSSTVNWMVGCIPLSSLGTSPPIESEIAYSIPPLSDLRLDRWAGTETNH